MILLEHAMTKPEYPAENEPAPQLLLSDEPTMELIVRARGGDRPAMEALLERCLPPLKRWAHGRLPAAARGRMDTGDLVQEAAMHAINNLDTFEPRHVGAMQAYLRQSVINRIRDEVRRIVRQPPPLELPDDHPSDRTSPLEFAIQEEAYEHYRDGLSRLSPKDRELVVGRIEVQWSLAEIAHRFGLRTVDAARMAVNRAVKRLTTDLAAKRN
ncbi:MAG TPA: sigma-70 family RNA polymerase sigma factor [Vicinamibacterales bacterium]|nr:sigma-70 family RNA polymerase sigma factor [Vicinamibacterales bacterium]